MKNVKDFGSISFSLLKKILLGSIILLISTITIVIMLLVGGPYITIALVISLVGFGIYKLVKYIVAKETTQTPTSKLVELEQLRANGVLNEEEFKSAKERLLEKL